MDEVWRAVVGLETVYDVSNKGNVRSLARLVPSGRGWDRQIPASILKPVVDSYGYFVVKLRVGGRGVMKKVHRLVAEAFIPNPEKKSQVNHKDANKQNNSTENLEWVTAKEHGRHSSEHGLRPRGSKNGQAKLTEEQIPIVRTRLAAGEPGAAIARDLGVSPNVIKMIRHRRQWNHV